MGKLGAVRNLATEVNEDFPEPKHHGGYFDGIEDGEDVTWEWRYDSESRLCEFHRNGIYRGSYRLAWQRIGSHLQTRFEPASLEDRHNRTDRSVLEYALKMLGLQKTKTTPSTKRGRRSS